MLLFHPLCEGKSFHPVNRQRFRISTDDNIVLGRGILAAVYVRFSIVFISSQRIKLIPANDLSLGEVVGQLCYSIHIPLDDLEPGAVGIAGITQRQKQVQLIVAQ